MIIVLEQVYAEYSSALITGWFVFLRVSGVVAFLPLFGEQSIPMRVKLGIAIAFSLVTGPAVAETIDQVDPTLATLILLGLPEILAGAFFGILLRLMVFALQIAGSIMAQSTSLSQIFGGSAGVDPQPAMGHVLVVSGLALLAVMDVHVNYAMYVIHSYQLIPFGTIANPADVAEMGLAAVSRTMKIGFCLAAPFIIASLLYNIVLGIINKAMPQLMVSFVGAPAITAGGLILLLLSAPFLLSVWLREVSQLIGQVGA